MYASPEGFSAETELSDYAIYECAYSGTTPLLPFLEFSFVLEIGKKKNHFRSFFTCWNFRIQTSLPVA